MGVLGANFSAGFVAGSLAAGATCPLDVAKTRRQIEVCFLCFEVSKFSLVIFFYKEDILSSYVLLFLKIVGGTLYLTLNQRFHFN